MWFSHKQYLWGHNNQNTSAGTIQKCGTIIQGRKREREECESVCVSVFMFWEHGIISWIFHNWKSVEMSEMEEDQVIVAYILFRSMSLNSKRNSLHNCKSFHLGNGNEILILFVKLKSMNFYSKYSVTGISTFQTTLSLIPGFRGPYNRFSCSCLVG